MLSLPPTVKVFVATGPADMRRSLDGLSALVREGMGRDPLSGHLFVFHNRQRDRAKVLYWDRSGMCLWYKRLEKGRFHFPATADASLEIEWAELQLLLEGIDLAGARRRKRFEPAPLEEHLPLPATGKVCIPVSLGVLPGARSAGP